MVKIALVFVVPLLKFTFAAPPKHDIGDGPNFSLVASDEKSDNASLVENFLDVPVFEIPTIVQKPGAGIQPLQWPLPEIFKRQAACSNYCGPSQSAPRTYCGCGQQCCGTGCCATASGQVCCAGGNGCCNTAAGAVCCGTACCTNGATCNGSKGCEFRTTVITRVATATTWFYRDITTTVSANGGTATITSTYRSVTIVTVSTADVATVIATATVTPGGAKRARDLQELRPAPTSELPQQTISPPPKVKKGQVQKILAPHITQSPLTLQHVAKRQVNNFVSTVTSVVSTITVSSTSTRLVTTTVAARATATYSTTIWQTVTSFVNAKSTTTSTTTLVLTPGVSVVNVVTVTDGSGGGGNNGGGGNGDNNGGNNENGSDQGQAVASKSSSLSTGAKAGIGAGTAGGSLLICIILSFWFWRRRKSREERNKEMIDNAVTSAMAAQAAASQRQSEIQPGRTYYDEKHVSTVASTTSPHPYSPSPEVLSPQPTYAYPPPAGQNVHQQGMYNNNNHGPMGFPESGMEAQGQQQYRYSAPGYSGSEIEGSPVQRYELAQFSSPPPQNVIPAGAVPHPGAYTQAGGREMDMGQGHGRPVYSDLPEVQRSDLPEVRR